MARRPSVLRVRGMPPTLRHVLATFTALAALALLPASAAAVPASAPWVARHGLNSGQYQAEFTRLATEGFRLLSVSGYQQNGKARYAAVWRKAGGAPQLARHGLSAAAYQQAFDANAKAGFRLVYVTGYEVAGQDRYAAIWEKRGGPALVARHRLTSQQYQAAFDALTKQGYRLLHVSGYTRAGAPRFAAIFEKSGGPEWVSFHRMTPAQYQAAYTKYAKAGFRLRTVSGYSVAGSDRYAALWEKSGGPVMRARNGIKGASYQRLFEVDRLEGYALDAVQAFASGGTVKFNTIWLHTMSAQDLAKIRGTVGGFLSKASVAGLQIAIAKDGRLLYSAGFGLADREEKIKLDAVHNMRSGSISKSITSTAIYKLIEEGRLKGLGNGDPLDRVVLGPNGLLPEIAVPPSMKALEGATVEHLLAHTSGLPGQMARFNQTGFQTGDPVNCAAGNLGERIEAELKRHAEASAAASPPRAPLIGKPGERYDYQNLDQNILEWLIERLTGIGATNTSITNRYSDYVRARVFGPSGITRSRLFGIGDYDPKWGEAKHYYAVDDPDAGSLRGKFAPYPASKTCDNEPPGTGAGGWAMSSRDLLRFFVSVDGRPGREIITPEHQADMLVPPTLANGTNSGYAKTWMVGGRGWGCANPPMITRPTRFGHNGGLAGAFSNMFEQSNGYSFVIMGNQGPRMGSCGDESVARLIPVIESVDWPEHDLF